MLRNKIFFFLILFFLALIVLNLITQKIRTHPFQYSEDLQAEVSHYIPASLPVQEARKIMEDSSFRCKNHKNNLFWIDNRSQNRELISQSKIEGDFLFCNKTQSYILSVRVWNVFLLYKKEKVTLVYASIHDQNL